MKMKKIMSVIVCLCIAIPAISMELQIKEKKKKREIVPLIITPQENQEFVSYLKRELGFCNQVAMVGYVSQDNPIYIMLRTLSTDLIKQYDNNVLELVKFQGLEERINNYKKTVDSNKMVTFCLQQIRARQGNKNEALCLITKNRRTLAEMKLQKLQPTYSCQYIGADEIQDGIEYMKRNADYPVNDENVVKDFIALLLYRVIFARQTY
jgi:hypothetical protein